MGLTHEKLAKKLILLLLLSFGCHHVLPTGTSKGTFKLAPTKFHLGALEHFLLRQFRIDRIRQISGLIGRLWLPSRPRVYRDTWRNGSAMSPNSVYGSWIDQRLGRENLPLMPHSWSDIFCLFYTILGDLKTLDPINARTSPTLQSVILKHRTIVAIILTDRHMAAPWLLRGVRTLRLLKRHVFFCLIGSQLCRIWQLLQFAKWSANTIWLLRVWKSCACVRVCATGFSARQSLNEKWRECEYIWWRLLLYLHHFLKNSSKVFVCLPQGLGDSTAHRVMSDGGVEVKSHGWLCFCVWFSLYYWLRDAGRLKSLQSWRLSCFLGSFLPGIWACQAEVGRGLQERSAIESRPVSLRDK